MKSHALGKRLQGQPDLPVYAQTPDGLVEVQWSAVGVEGIILMVEDTKGC